MPDKYVGVALVLSAQNQASMVLDEFFSRTEAKMRQFGKGMAKIGEGIAEVMAAKKGVDALKATTNAYGDMEEAGNYLKARMMGKGGMFDQAMYERVFQYTKDLSAHYTGSVASYLDMVRVMEQNRLDAKDILGGIGEGAAKLGIYFGNMLPAATAEFAAHMRNDMGVAAKQMYDVMDLTARVHDIGVGKTGQEAVEEMNQFFSKVGLGLANLHTQGLEASKQIAAVGAIFMAKGISGQSVGTNFRRILDGIASGEKVKKANIVAGYFKKHLDFFDKKGNFLGVENFVAQLGKLQGLNPAAIEAILKPFSGKQGLSTDFLQFLANDGVNTYAEMKRRIEDQATLNDKVAQIMQGQKMQGAVLESNVTNTKASFGRAIAAPYRELLAVLNRVTVGMGVFFDKHRRLAEMAAGFVAVASAALGLMGVLKILSGVRLIMGFLGMTGPLAGIVKGLQAVRFAGFALQYHFMTGLVPALARAGLAMRAFGVAAMANPVRLIIAGIVAIGVAAFLIYKHWDGIKAFFSRMWGNVVRVFRSVGNVIHAAVVRMAPQWLIGVFREVASFLAMTWGGISKVFMAGYHLVSWVFMNLTPAGWVIKYWQPLSTFFKGVWDLVSAVFKAGVYGVWLILKYLTPVGLVYKYWKPITGFFSSLWDGVRVVFGAAARAVGWVLLNMTPVGLIYKYWKPIVGFFSSLWDGVKSVFTGVFKWVWDFGSSFVHAGEHIVESIIGGIMGKVKRVGEVMSNVAATIRSYLPFSPAKAGALRDIHRIKLFETIAKGLNADALIGKVRDAMARVRMLLQPPALKGAYYGMNGVTGAKNLLPLQAFVLPFRMPEYMGRVILAPAFSKGEGLFRQGVSFDGVTGQGPNPLKGATAGVNVNSSASAVFAPVINLYGTASKGDGDMMMARMRQEWERWQREKDRRGERTRY